MIAQKIIQTTTDVDLDIKEVTLLTEEEYLECKDRIPLLGSNWWLKSPGEAGYRASVKYDGSVDRDTHPGDALAVRPVLYFYSSTLSIGDQVIITMKDATSSSSTHGGECTHMWDVISDHCMICHDNLTIHPFCCVESYYVVAMTYEESSLKKYIDRWIQTYDILGDVS